MRLSRDEHPLAFWLLLIGVALACLIVPAAISEAWAGSAGLVSVWYFLFGVGLVVPVGMAVNRLGVGEGFCRVPWDAWRSASTRARAISALFWLFCAAMWIYSLGVVLPTYMAFLGHSRQYLALKQLPVSDTGGPLAGKIVTLNAKSGVIDPLMFSFPRSVWATSPAEVGTVVLVERESIVIGNYTNGAEARRQAVTLDIIDMKSPVSRAVKSFFGSAPPDTIVVRHGTGRGDAVGDKATGYREYLLSLPRQ